MAMTSQEADLDETVPLEMKNGGADARVGKSGMGKSWKLSLISLLALVALVFMFGGSSRAGQAHEKSSVFGGAGHNMWVEGAKEDVGLAQDVAGCNTKNVALKRPTGQISQGWGGVPGRAVDGNPSGIWGHASCTHTALTPNPWWYVDIGNQQPVCGVRMYNRRDCCSNRLTQFRVFVTNRKPIPGRAFVVHASEVCYTYNSKTPFAVKDIKCARPMRGRYVGVQIMRKEYLTICEFRVFTTRSNSGPGLIRQWKCAPGSYRTGKDQRGNCVCTKCPFGYRCPGGMAARVACDKGTYQNRKGQSTCLNAPAGTHVPNRGMRNPMNCRPGRYQPLPKQAVCKLANTGHYVPRPRATGQLKCPRGKYQNQRGQSSCKNAPRGHYVPGLAATRPFRCSPGQYQNRVGQASCRKARRGRYANGAGMHLDRACPRNTFQDCVGQVACVPCPRGTRSGVGATRCHGGPQTVSFVDPAGIVFGSDKFRFLALNAPRKFKSVTFTWQGRNQITLQYPPNYTPFGDNVGINLFLQAKVLSSSGTTGVRAGQTVFWCKACGSRSAVKYGDTCWGILPLSDRHRHCGCNSGGWTGNGVYYGGFLPHKCNRCACWGGGLSGYRANRQQKGKVNVGVKITVNS